MGPNPNGPTSGVPPVLGAPSGPDRAPVTGDLDVGVDLTVWSFWWELNKQPYLNLKEHVFGSKPVSGDAGYFLGPGERDLGRETSRPPR